MKKKKTLLVDLLHHNREQKKFKSQQENSFALLDIGYATNNPGNKFEIFAVDMEFQFLFYFIIIFKIKGKVEKSDLTVGGGGRS